MLRHILLAPLWVGALVLLFASPMGAWRLVSDGEWGLAAVVLGGGWLVSAGLFAIAGVLAKPGTTAPSRPDAAVHDEPELSLSLSRDTLGLGESLSVRLGDDAKARIGARQATLALRCLEVAKTDAPITTRSWSYSNIIHEEAQVLSRAEREGGEIAFTIPTQAPPTFATAHAHAIWQFYLSAPAAKDLPALAAELQTITVEPRLAKDASYRLPEFEAGEPQGDAIRIELRAGGKPPLLFEPGMDVRGSLVIRAERARKAKTLSVDLTLSAYGHCTTDEDAIDSLDVLVPRLAAGETFEQAFAFRIPTDGPISYAGNLFAITWYVRVRSWGDWLGGTVSTAADIVVVPGE
jgi:hypothetical protein